MDYRKMVFEKFNAIYRGETDARKLVAKKILKGVLLKELKLNTRFDHTKVTLQLKDVRIKMIHINLNDYDLSQLRLIEDDKFISPDEIMVKSTLIKTSIKLEKYIIKELGPDVSTERGVIHA